MATVEHYGLPPDQVARARDIRIEKDNKLTQVRSQNDADRANIIPVSSRDKKMQKTISDNAKKLYADMKTAGVLPDDLSAALAHAASVDCPPAVRTSWREAIKHLDDGVGVAGVKDAVRTFILNTKHLVKHAAAIWQRLCVSYLRSSNEHLSPVNID